MDILTEIFQFIWEKFIRDGVIIILLCNILGYCIKNFKAFEHIQNKYIPLICGVAGFILAFYTPGMYEGDDRVTVIIKGFILGFASTGIYECFRNIVNIKIKEMKNNAGITDDTK